jgi:hypothetical protein
MALFTRSRTVPLSAVTRGSSPLWPGARSARSFSCGNALQPTTALPGSIVLAERLSTRLMAASTRQPFASSQRRVSR